MAVSWVLLILSAAVVEGVFSLNYAPTDNPVVKDGKRSGYVCRDDRNCTLYPKEQICNTSKPWEMVYKCPFLCGYCHEIGQQFQHTPTKPFKTTSSALVVSTTPSTTIVSPERPPTNVPNQDPFIGVTLAPGIKCQDSPSAICSLYNLTLICDVHGKYYSWARENCLLSCGFCRTCEDRPSANCILYNTTSLCDIYGPYLSWARYNCPLHCGFCNNDTVLLQLPSANIPTTAQASVTPNSHICRDTENCRLYNYNIICTNGSIYLPWAQNHCPVYCGFCQVPTKVVPCVDRVTNCDEYQSDMCTNPLYRIFREDNCRKHCKICTDLDSMVDYSSVVG